MANCKARAFLTRGRRAYFLTEEFLYLKAPSKQKRSFVRHGSSQILCTLGPGRGARRVFGDTPLSVHRIDVSERIYKYDCLSCDEANPYTS